MFYCHQQKIQKICFFFIFVFQGFQNSVPSLLTWISFFSIKFENFCYFCSQFPRNLVLSLWANLKDRIFKIKQYFNIVMVIYQNILEILRAFLNLQKYFYKNPTPSILPQLLLLNFLAKFLTERKYLMNTLIFVRQKYLLMFHKIYKFYNK